MGSWGITAMQLSSRSHRTPDNDQPAVSELVATAGRLRPASREDADLADLTELAAVCCDAPLALLILGDEPGVTVAAHGARPGDLPSALAVCGHAANAAELFVVSDTLSDARFSNDPLRVHGEPARFQAAAPVRAEHGSLLAVLCVADHEPRALAPRQADALRALARQAAAMLGLRARLTELERAERPLRQRAAQQAGAADLGQRALRGLDLPDLMTEAAELIADKLDLAFSQVWELLPDGERLVLRAGVGWPADAIGSLIIPVDPHSQPGFNLLTGGSVFIQDVASEERFSPPDFIAKQGAASGFSVSIPGPEQPFGVIGGHVMRRRTFTDDDASFQQSVANVVGAAIERRRAEQDVRHRATHDPLTGLANRTLLIDRLALALENDGQRPAVVFLDLDRFKLINDSLGHDVGDELLVSVAARLRETLRPGDTVARFGGDEFVLLLEHVAGAQTVRAVAKRIAAALKRPLDAGGDQHGVTASVGLAIAARRHRQPETLLQEADAAMYRAKQRARGSYELFDDSMLAAASSELRIERALRSAVENDELELFYQPLVSLGDGQIVGLEALLRWVNPDLGPVAPREFIPIAEDSGLIVPVGEWVLRAACRQMTQWTEALGTRPALPVSVNVSARQLKEPNFSEIVATTLRESRLAPHQLGLELTESVLLDGVTAPLDALESLKHLGVRLILDDFGTGYSSLSYLKRFPLDAIKIDRSFVSGLGTAGHDSAIVDAVLGMSRALGLLVVAEGVEDERQLAHLQERGAQIGQGYLFAPPMSGEALWPLLAAAPERRGDAPGRRQRKQ